MGKVKNTSDVVTTPVKKSGGWLKRFIIICLSFLLGLGLSLYLLDARRNEIKALEVESQAEYNETKAKFDAKLKELEDLTNNREAETRKLEDELAQTDPAVKFMLTSTDELEEVAGIAAKVSGIQWTWDSGELYSKRREEVEPFVTQEVLDSGFFSVGKDGSGNYTVDVMGLTGSFESLRTYLVSSNDREIEFLADVRYVINRAPGSEAYQGSSSDVLSVYRFVYDRNAKKIKDMDVIGQMSVETSYDQDDIQDNENQTPINPGS